MGRRGKRRERMGWETVAMCCTLTLACGLFFMAMHACWQTGAVYGGKPAVADVPQSRVKQKKRGVKTRDAARVRHTVAKEKRPPASPAPAVPNAAIHGKVTAVYDGDTVTVEDDCGETYQLRLHGIDAPERKQEYGNMARLALTGMVLGKRVAIQQTAKDRYGRMVGRLYVDGRDVNCAMVSNGHAWHYAKYAPEDTEIGNAEEFARRHRLGIWGEPAPTPPWMYRKQHEQAAGRADATPADEAEGLYWISSTGKTHNSTCRYYEATEKGYHTNEPSGNDCEICGGAEE